MNWGSNKDWIDYNFRNLSEQIFDASKVSISVRTLKRIFRQETDSNTFYEPQIATKNALAVFLEYKDWAEFVRVNFPRSTGTEQDESELREEDGVPLQVHNAPQQLSPPSRPKNRSLLLIPALLVLFLVFGILFWGQQKAPLKFTSKNIIADNYAFGYDLSGMSYNTATVDLDHAIYKALLNKKGEFSYPFKLPDYYKVKLIVDGETVARRDIHILSKGWVSVVEQNHKERLISDRSLHHRNQLLHLPAEELAKIKIDTTDEYWLDFRNIRNFDIDGDNLLLEIDVKNDQSGGGQDCFDTSIEYMGVSGTGRVKLVRPGCANFAVFEFGEVRFNGNFHDLSPFGIDLSKWNTVKIKVENKRVRVYLNNRLAYKNSYKEPIGQVRGFKIKFKGSGSMDNIRVFNSDKRLVYRDNFDSAPIN
ncbi:hypothetical protein [Arcticibacter sp. MXS-1]|uniref:hypothetical protein n=1 Tax=Arcticibacter sp. MXS-1 TaxID=3341726 RepID=UPI0035A824B3